MFSGGLNAVVIRFNAEGEIIFQATPIISKMEKNVDNFVFYAYKRWVIILSNISSNIFGVL